MRQGGTRSIAYWLLRLGALMACDDEHPTERGADPATTQDAAIGGDASEPGWDGQAPSDAGQALDTGASLDAHAGLAVDATAGRDARGPDVAFGDGGAGAPWLISSGDAVFFVGNSFFGGEDDRLSEWVRLIGAALPAPFAIETGEHIVYGNQPLSWFFEQPESQQAIQSGRYKVFVLQGEEREPVDHKAEFKQAVHDYYDAVTARGGRIMLFMTWDFSWECQTDFFNKLANTYEEIGEELNVPVIPVGLIYDDCNKHPYDGEQPYWLTSQELHQNEKGTAANAYATFAMLTGINPMGQNFVAYRNTNSPELLKYLSDMAWSEVAPRLAGQIPQRVIEPGPCPQGDAGTP